MLSFSNIPPVWQQVCKNTACFIAGGSVASFALSKIGQSHLARLSLILSFSFANITNMQTLNTYYYQENPRRIILNDAVGRFLNVAVTLLALDIFLGGSPKVTALVLIATAIFIKINYNRVLNTIIQYENRAAEQSASDALSQDKK